MHELLLLSLRKNRGSVLLLHDWLGTKIRCSMALPFQGIRERAFSQALKSSLAKVSPSQPGLALVELNKPGYTEEALASLDLA